MSNAEDIAQSRVVSSGAVTRGCVKSSAGAWLSDASIPGCSSASAPILMCPISENSAVCDEYRDACAENGRLSVTSRAAGHGPDAPLS